MDMSNFRSELHIAQQSRRDKLRIQQDLSPYVNSFPTQNYDSAADRSCRNGNICYDPSEFCPEMINFSANNMLKDGLMGHPQPEKRGGDAPFPTSFHPSAAVELQYFNTWKSVASQPNTNWVTNESSNLMGGGDHQSLRIMNNVKPNYVGFQELHSPSEMNGNPSAYQNALQDLVTSSNVRSFGLEFASLRQKNEAGNGHWPTSVGGSELLLLPAYADHMRLKNQPDNLISRPMPLDNCSHQWSGGEDLNFAAVPKAVDHRDHSNTQALSLSLSSVPSPKVHETQINERDFQTRDHVCGSSNTVLDSRTWMNPGQNNLSTGSRNLGTPTAALTHRNPGPLGPFTGYATILRSSKFLRPAQQLLEEFCCIARPKNVEICDVSDEFMEEVRVSSGGVGNGEQHVMKGAAGGSSSGVSSFVLDGCSDKGRHHGGASCSSEAYRPESLQRKAKLLIMQDEVCKKYKQYHQQMQMVVASFETVAGLTAATPYVSLALKMISKNFRSLKNAITDQIKTIRNVLGEELSSPSGGTSSSKGDGNVSMLKFFDQSFQKQKGSGSNILDGQHIWRPQRGLPERAVSILRAWLFDHFLHPYPTDTDKHMLASQTGLTRNQVSNWFINARVRVWKPMVEEIHMLESKGLDNGGKMSSNGKTAVEGCGEGNDNSSQSLNRLRMRAVPDKQVECSTVGRSAHETDRSNARMWNNQEKRSRMEYHHVPGGVDGSLMGLVTPSHHRSGGIEMGGIGSVSLTLGLRQSAENAQQERHLRHYGGQMIRDFVG